MITFSVDVLVYTLDSQLSETDFRLEPIPHILMRVNLGPTIHPEEPGQPMLSPHKGINIYMA